MNGHAQTQILHKPLRITLESKILPLPRIAAVIELLRDKSIIISNTSLLIYKTGDTRFTIVCNGEGVNMKFWIKMQA